MSFLFAHYLQALISFATVEFTCSKNQRELCTTKVTIWKGLPDFADFGRILGSNSLDVVGLLVFLDSFPIASFCLLFVVFL